MNIIPVRILPYESFVETPRIFLPRMLSKVLKIKEGDIVDIIAGEKSLSLHAIVYLKIHAELSQVYLEYLNSPKKVYIRKSEKTIADNMIDSPESKFSEIYTRKHETPYYDPVMCCDECGEPIIGCICTVDYHITVRGRIK